MKQVLLASAALVGLVHGASAYTITTSQTLPSLASLLTPTPSSGVVLIGVGDQTIGGQTVAKSPFDGVSGYENASYEAVLGGKYATFTKAQNPGFVTGGDTFSFILGSPDAFNTVSFTGGATSTSVGSGAFGVSGSGYEVVTIGGLGSYDTVTFASSSNALEFATYNVSAVPLPASLPMFGLALLGLGGLAVARQRKGRAVMAA